MFTPYNSQLKQFSRDLRKNATPQEVIVWSMIRRKQIHGIRFYRQKPILSFILDFYAPSIRLAIEIDGGQHYGNKGKKNDQLRDELLEGQGIAVLRFSNTDVNTNREGVHQVIGSKILELLR